MNKNIVTFAILTASMLCIASSAYMFMTAKVQVRWIGDNPYDSYFCTITNINPPDGATHVGRNPTFSFDVTTDCPECRVMIDYTYNRGFIDQVTWQGVVISGNGTYTEHIEYTPPSYISFPNNVYQWRIRVVENWVNVIYKSDWMFWYVESYEPVQSPVADADGEYYGVVGEPVYLDASKTYDPDGDKLSFAWELNENGFYDDLKAKTGYYIWSEPGEYIIYLRVIDDDGYYDYAETKAYISPQPDNQPPVALCNMPKESTVTVGETVVLDASASYDPDGYIVKYEWDVDGLDGYDYTGKIIRIEYTRPMSYHLTLHVVDDDGAGDTYSFVINVVEEEVTQEKYYLNVRINPEDAGFVNISPVSEYYLNGITVILQAFPYEGYEFDHWSGDIFSYDNPISVVMDSNKTVVANFVSLTPQKEENNFAMGLFIAGILGMVCAVVYNKKF